MDVTRHPGFGALFSDALSLGLMFPIEAYAGDTPRMQDQEQLARRAEDLGFAALAFVPVLGYLTAVALPGLAARLRRRAPERYAGLRTLAK